MTGLGDEDYLRVDYFSVLVAGGVGNWCIITPTKVSVFVRAGGCGLLCVGILFYLEDRGVFNEHASVDAEVFEGGSIISGFWGLISVDYQTTFNQSYYFVS